MHLPVLLTALLVAAPYGQPLFTKTGAPICTSRDALAAYLAAVRDGAEPTEGVGRTNCFPAPEGVPITVLDTEGVIDVWVRARATFAGGGRPIIWTVLWMLRN